MSSFRTARNKDSAYSVPAPFIKAHLLAYVTVITASFLHVFVEVACYPRVHARQARIDNRHVIASLVRKPQCLRAASLPQGTFPRPVFRQAYDRLVARGICAR